MLTVARGNDQGHSWSETFVAIPSDGYALTAVFVEPVGIQRRGSLLLCGSLLDERKHLYRDIVNLSRALSREGFVVLRFDYRGFGESTGASWQVHLPNCVDDAVACFRWMHKQQPELPAACVGIALGAIIAAQVVMRVGAQALIACQPLWSVAANHRRTFWAGFTSTTALTNYTSYCIDRELYEQIASSHLKTTIANTGQSNQRALILHLANGTPAKAARQYQAQLTAANVAVSTHTLNAKRFWLSAELGMPLDQIVQPICAWLTGQPGIPTLAENSQTPYAEYQNDELPPIDRKGGQTCESPNRGFVELEASQTPESVETRGWLPLRTGTLALSIDVAAQQGERTLRRGVLLLPTIGLRSGPHDIYTHFSHQLAASGLVCLRFDYSSCGDSLPAINQPWQIQVLRDEAESTIRFFCEQFALDELILLGFCTGGEIALSVSQSIPQVVACVLWSTAALHSPLTLLKRLRHAYSMMRQYMQKLWHGATWRKIITGQVDIVMVYQTLVKRQVAPDTEKKAALAYSEQPSTVREHLPVLCVYGEHDPDRREARRYYQRLLGKDVSIAIVPQADHNFSSWLWDKSVCQLTTEWMHTHNLIMHPATEANDHA